MRPRPWLVLFAFAGCGGSEPVRHGSAAPAASATVTEVAPPTAAAPGASSSPLPSPSSSSTVEPLVPDAGSRYVGAGRPLSKLLQDSIGARVSAPDPKAKRDKTVEILAHHSGGEQLFAAIGLDQVPSGEPARGIPCASLDFVDGIGNPLANLLVFCDKGALVDRATFVMRRGSSSTSPASIRLVDPKALQDVFAKNDLRVQ